jgi:hypothetical protein
LTLTPLEFGYNDACARLAHPLARAIRPDLLSGRHVEGARERAAQVLGPIAARRRVLAYDPASAEFVELTPDGAAVLGLLARHGSLAALQSGQSGPSRARLDEFAAELHRLGLLHASRRRTAPAPEAAATILP